VTTNNHVHLERDGHVATLLIDRPEKLNAMTVAMDATFNEFCREINLDNEIRSVILTGTGRRAFCAGSDIGDLDEYGTNWEYRNRFDAQKDYVHGLWGIRKPIVAAIFGYCIGGGLELACASDIRVCSPDASFGAGEIRWGWHGGSGATQYLTRAVGPGHASKLLMSGDRIEATEAYRIGLVQDLVERDDLMDHAKNLAINIAEKGPIAVQSSKNLIRVAQSASIEVGLRYENDMFSYCMLTADAAEGRSAFAEKRTPEFRGE